jgi:hypothetical protein
MGAGAAGGGMMFDAPAPEKTRRVDPLPGALDAAGKFPDHNEHILASRRAQLEVFWQRRRQMLTELLPLAMLLSSDELEEEVAGTVHAVRTAVANLRGETGNV